MPSAILAQIVSAFICRRYKLNTKQCAAFIAVCHVVVLALIISKLFIGCGNSPVAGINSPYYDGIEFNSTEQAIESTR